MSVAVPARYRALAGLPRADRLPLIGRQRLMPFTARMFGPGYVQARHHHLIAETLERAAWGELTRVVIAVPPRHGKALAPDTPIPTPTGWTTMGALRPGDRVLGADGAPCTVTAVSPVWRDRPVWRVLVEGGEEILADAAHEWPTPYGIRETQRLGNAVAAAGRAFRVRAVPAGTGETVCIAVDRPDRLFLAGRAMVPTHNSELASVHFPAWYLGNWPDRRIIACSYTASLAYRFSRRARNLLADPRWPFPDVAPAGDSRNVSAWDIAGRRGGYVAAGVGGSITGFGADCVAGETLVETPAGPRRIADLVRERYAGDVLAFDLAAGRAAWRPVVASRQAPGPRALLRIAVEGGPPLRCTPDHRVFAGGRGWTEARLLRPGDALVRAAGPGRVAADRVTAIEPDRGAPGPVFDLQVRDLENFFADGIAVHNCLLIDDPVKNQEEAASPVIQERNREWFQSTAMTRVEPGGSVVIVSTRWHEADLVGAILAGDPAGWTVIELPAIAEGGDDPLGRAPGEALWPERWGERALAERRAAVGERAWNALFQQRPSPAEGAVFRREWWRRWGALPEMAAAEIAVDSAFKTGVSADHTVLALWATDGQGSYYLVDLRRGRMEFPELVRAVHDFHAAARARFPRLAVPVVIEDAASGQSALQVLSRPYRTPGGALLPALPAVAWPTRGASKAARADAVSPLVEAGRVFLPESAPWVSAFVEEHAAFPAGAHDDQVDATAMGLARLSRPRPSGVWSV